MSTPQASTDKYKEQARQEWTEVAESWRKWNAQFVVRTRAATEAIVQAAQVKPGMLVLDVASGSGEPALTLAAAVGRNGHVTATDLVPEMLTIAEEDAGHRGLSNISFQQADAEDLPFPDQTFDRVTCRFGVMFFPNVGKALREIRRVLKPSGLAAFIAWGPLEQNPHAQTTNGVLRKYVQMPPPEPGATNPFKFAQPGTLSGVLREAGFRRVQEEPRTIPEPWPGSVESFWECRREQAPSIRRLLEKLSPEQLEQVNAEVLAAIRQYHDGHQVNFTACIVLASGMR